MRPTWTIATFVFAAFVREWFEAGGPELQREIAGLVRSNLTLAAQTVRIDAKKPFSRFAESFEPGQSSPEPIEPPTSPMVEVQCISADGARSGGDDVDGELTTVFD